MSGTSSSGNQQPWNASGTLCWSCKKAVPVIGEDGEAKGCEWTLFKRPVPGWKAELSEIKIKSKRSSKSLESYNVRECPEFERG